ncbi:MAG: hypothetical protein [Bacteriophage sp.]|mgnify:FL=1|jgi:hypothetical protein|nr:MAG: hypothetical protein [Bacteriophage sp.]
MTLTIDDVIALRANCDDYVNAFKVLEQSKLDFQRAEDNLMSNLPAVGFRVTGQTNIDDLPTIVKDSMVSKASKQLDSSKITINDRDVEKPVHPVQGLMGTPIEMENGEVKYAEGAFCGVTVRTIVIDSHTFSGGDTRATCREALKYLIDQLLSNKIDPTKSQSTELLVRLYNIAKKYGVNYFNSNTMPIDGNGANPLRAVYYAARLLELPKPILYCV